MDYGAAYPMDISELPVVGLHDDELGTLATEAGLESAEVLTVEGVDAAQAICVAAEEHNVDVIVVGAHDRGILDRLLNPSVSHAVLEGTDRPVLVVTERRPTS
jgi:nucleotide-binding universal stress UspA family protein